MGHTAEAHTQTYIFCSPGNYESRDRAEQSSFPPPPPIPPLSLLHCFPKSIPKVEHRSNKCVHVCVCGGVGWFKANFVNYEEYRRLRCNLNSWVSRWETMHLRETAGREMKAWRSNQDLENLIRRVEEVQHTGWYVTAKQDAWREVGKKTQLGDIWCPPDIVLSCFYKAKVCYWVKCASTLQETQTNVIKAKTCRPEALSTQSNENALSDTPC